MHQSSHEAYALEFQLSLIHSPLLLFVVFFFFWMQSNIAIARTFTAARYINPMYIPEGFVLSPGRWIRAYFSYQPWELFILETKRGPKLTPHISKPHAAPLQLFGPCELLQLSYTETAIHGVESSQ